MRRSTASTRISRFGVAPLGLVACLSGCAPFLSTPGPVVADRPGYTDTPTALPRGALQLEAGVTDDQEPHSSYVSAGETLLRVGAGARTEIRLFGNSYATRLTDDAPTVRGLEDPKLGVKANLRSVADSVHAWIPNIAALVAVTVPIGASGIGTTHAQPEGKLAANWTTPSPFSAYTNVGYSRVYDGPQWGAHGWASLAIWYAATPRVSFFGEGITTSQLSGGAPAGNDLDAGITVLINDRFQLDARAGHGVGGETSSERFFGVGFARRW